MSASSPQGDGEFAAMDSLGSFRRGQGGTKADARPSGVPCVRYGDLYTKHDCVIRGFASFVAPERASSYTTLKPGDIVFAGSGETHEEIGKGSAYCGTELAVAGGDTIIFSPRAGVDSRFLGYACNANDAARFKARHGQGSSVIHIGVPHLSQLRVFAPPLPEQRRIAEILDTLDEAIRKTEQVIAKLQQMKQGLLHDLLTRGIDENGELRDPERHPEQFQDSPLGRIPKAWKMIRLDSQIGRIGSGWSPVCHPTPAQPGEWGSLKTTCISWAGYREEENKSLPADLAPRPEIVVERNDILITRVGPRARIGVVCHVHETNGRMMLSDNMLRTRLVHDTKLLPAFVPFVLGSSAIQKDWNGKKVGLAEAQMVMTQRILRNTSVQCPSTDEQEAIISRLRSADSHSQALHMEADKLRSVRRGLMDDLLTGRVRVPVTEQATT